MEKQFGKICFRALILVLSIAVGGFVWMKMWEWLITPTFDIKALSFFQSTGISLFLIKLHPRKKEDDELTSRKLFEHFCISLINEAFILEIAWAITHFL